MVESFWAIPDVTEVRTPLSILREQANALTEQTKGVLVGMVEVYRDSQDGDLTINLEVSVPALNGYRYRIISYRQPVELYPGTFSGDPIAKIAISNGRVIDEEQFITYIKVVLSSERIRRVLGTLLSQAKDA